MDHKEKYNKYMEMYKKIPGIIQLIKDYCKANAMTIISPEVYVAVGNEEKDEYFVDYEYKSPVTPYRRVYGKIPESEFQKIRKELGNK